ncbi:hypothetical protein CHL78_016825 [Romboutsia weinsteinii]|uniref:DUF308 domain-containing protein n=1 Tax=Romboutsia weinsteinii TaxID=2020949 RepID=A0A371IZ06_9FIRM|nr:DUF308 domain-containing protein [Romboutsia weinsteinii]RDY25704.1 hypothetical protein CHL78_016825 [Romboutsia weinsteinii]
MNINKNAVSPIIILMISILLLVTGVLIIYDINIFAEPTIYIVSITLAIMGFLQILAYIFKREKRFITTFLSGIGDILLAIFIKHRTMFIALSIVKIIGIYAFINFMARITAAIILYKNKTRGWIRGFIVSGISLIFSSALIFHTKEYMHIVPIVAGAYLILYSCTIFGDFIREIFYADLVKDNLKRRMRITIPIVYAAFIPQKLLEDINEVIATKPTELLYEDIKVDTDAHLEIFIHLSKECANGFGHVDICFEDKIYTYGTYDESSNRLFKLVSDGVLIEVDRDKYIEFSTRDKQRSLVGFELKLSKVQREAIRCKISSIKDDCVVWKCKAQENPDVEYTEYSNMLYRVTNAKFYKFKSGYFKTYFTLTANCVRLAETIVGSAGLDIIAINGIITPGTYYNYLNNLFMRKNTRVVKRNLYTKIIK